MVHYDFSMVIENTHRLMQWQHENKLGFPCIHMNNALKCVLTFQKMSSNGLEQDAINTLAMECWVRLRGYGNLSLRTPTGFQVTELLVKKRQGFCGCFVQ
jgi:hypothetical protein